MEVAYKRLDSQDALITSRAVPLCSILSAMTAIAIDPLLSEVTKLQVEEFEQFKQTYRTRYGIGVPRPANVTLRERVAKLVKDIQQYDSYLEVDEDLDIIAQCVEWMGNDDCISNDKLLKFEQQILEKLHKRMSRYEVTSLHLNLMKEVMDASRSRKSSSADIGGSDDEFEVVETGLDQLIETFETESFTAKDVDVEALEAYLTDLMRANGTLDSLNDLRRAMRRFGDDILDGDDDPAAVVRAVSRSVPRTFAPGQVACRDFKLATVCHGVAGIGRQIEKHRVQPGRIDDRRP